MCTCHLSPRSWIPWKPNLHVVLLLMTKVRKPDYPVWCTEWRQLEGRATVAQTEVRLGARGPGASRFPSLNPSWGLGAVSPFCLCHPPPVVCLTHSVHTQKGLNIYWNAMVAPYAGLVPTFGKKIIPPKYITFPLEISKLNWLCSCPEPKEI